jgi:hypothetical protein
VSPCVVGLNTRYCLQPFFSGTQAVRELRVKDGKYRREVIEVKEKILFHTEEQSVQFV